MVSRAYSFASTTPQDKGSESVLTFRWTAAMFLRDYSLTGIQAGKGA